MEESATFFQIHSSERPDLCIEVFKTLEQVGRLWLQQCKSKDERGIERQTFAITNDGKLHPSTKSNSCIFLYSKKNFLRYRKGCTSLIHSKKNQFGFSFFDGTIFLMGDSLKKVITVWELQERNQVKLQKRSSSKIRKQHWTLHFERDRILGNCCSACNPTAPFKYQALGTPTISPTYQGIPNDLYPMYKMIATKEEYANYLNIWVLNHNVNGENDASTTEKILYQEQVKKYG